MQRVGGTDIQEADVRVFRSDAEEGAHGEPEAFEIHQPPDEDEDNRIPRNSEFRTQRSALRGGHTIGVKILQQAADARRAIDMHAGRGRRFLQDLLVVRGEHPHVVKSRCRPRLRHLQDESLHSTHHRKRHAVEGAERERPVRAAGERSGEERRGEVRVDEIGL